MASITIRCGPSHKSRRSRPNNNSLAGYMPKFEKASHRQVVRVKRTVPAANRFAALAIDTSSKSPRGQRFNGPRPSTAQAVQGSWGKKLAVNQAPVSNSRRVATRVQQAKPQPPQGQKQGRPCAYCKELGHHIKHCPVLAAKNAKKAEWSRKNKARKAEEKRKAAEARLAEQFRIAQQAKQQVVVEESSDSDSDSDGDDWPAMTAAIASGKVTTQRGTSRRVTFKDDSENLMKPPCDTKVFNKEDAPSAISDEDEEEVILLQKAQDIFKPSANAWRPRHLERQVILDQIKEKEAELASYSTDSWADACEIEELEEQIEELRAKLA